MLQIKMLLKIVNHQLLTIDMLVKLIVLNQRKKTDCKATYKKIEEKIPNYDKFTTTTESDKLTKK